MKYILLMHPSNSSDCYVLSDNERKVREFSTLDEAVKEGMAFGTDDFWVITKHNWKAVEDK